MMEQAVPLVNSADLFAVIGTSLVVYPAAGLLQYVKPGTPIYILDKKMPVTALSQPVTAIEKPATEGIAVFMALLRNSML
jgi:NAD-dependent deacetylase